MLCAGILTKILESLHTTPTTRKMFTANSLLSLLRVSVMINAIIIVTLRSRVLLLLKSRRLCYALYSFSSSENERRGGFEEELLFDPFRNPVAGRGRRRFFVVVSDEDGV